MKFFKHFTDAHEGKSMMALMSKFGLEGYAAFFILTELCAKKFEKGKSEEVSEDHLRFTFHERILREKLRMRSTKVELFLNYCATLDLLQVHKNSEEFHFYFPKLLESMDRDSRRARPVRDKNAPKIKNKDKDKDKDIIKETTYVVSPLLVLGKHSRGNSSPRETFEVHDVSDLISHLDPKVFARWNQLYSAEYVEREMLKMVNYLVANPAKNKKTKRGFSMFASNWLDRGWPKYQAQSSGKSESGVLAWLRSQEDSAG